MKVNPQRSQAPKARYIMIGGFLGAGKTTSVLRLAEQLTTDGVRVGLITNDQGRELVDTAMLRARGFPTEEIPGGCFCCRFNSLLEAAERLSRVDRPEVFVAEPVGSCTDLVATVTYPLRRIYGDDFVVAPLSVLVDPVRAQQVLGLLPGRRFSDKVLYVYRKQLEEADLIVINKVDLLSPEALVGLQTALEREYPRGKILIVSAREKQGLSSWFECILSGEQTVRDSLSIDYATYGAGEALLGWFNGTARVTSSGEVDANKLLERLAARIRDLLESSEAEVAHLKMTLSPDVGLGDIAVINLVRNDVVPELSLQMERPIREAQLIINLRAEAAPGRLRAAVERALRSTVAENAGLRISLEHAEQFRPSPPTPTHRDNRFPPSPS